MTEAALAFHLLLPTAFPAVAVLGAVVYNRFSKRSLRIPMTRGVPDGLL